MGRAEEIVNKRSRGQSKQSKLSSETITTADSDGIVNTLSMMWPDRDKTKLVFGDHADVIGHFQHMDPQTSPETGEEKRPRDMTYDLLQSRSKFDEGKFMLLWRDILSFAIRG